MSLNSCNSLYNLCLSRLHNLIQAGNRNACFPNPLACLPSHIINDLISLVPKYPYPYRPKIADLYIYLSTGKCTVLNLDDYNLEAEQDILLKILSEGGFKFLRNLSINTEHFAPISLIQQMIRCSPKLESFYSKIFFDFDVFRNHKALRCLRFINHSNGFGNEKLYMDLSVLKSQKKLEVFYVTGLDEYPELIAAVLENCPKLVSLGSVDSLGGLEIIHRNAVNKYITSHTDAFSYFMLRRCEWGLNPEAKIRCSDIRCYKNKFPEKVKIAVSLCPLVEELVLHVYHKDGMEDLKNLKQLSYLRIDFSVCVSDYLPAFTSLLQKIGSQLTHLSLNFERLFPLDIIFENCPNLEALEISNAILATAGKSVRPYSNVSVQKLTVYYPGKENLLFLLASCKNLTDLVVQRAYCLDDNLMNEIVKLNPLSKLKTAGFSECTLSRISLRNFLSSAVSLERLAVAPKESDASYLYHFLEMFSGGIMSLRSIETIEVIAELKLNVEYVDFLDIMKNEYFLHKRSTCIF